MLSCLRTLSSLRRCYSAEWEGLTISLTLPPSTGYVNIREVNRQLFGPEVIDQTREVWGLDSEGEVNGSYRPSGYPGVCRSPRLLISRSSPRLSSCGSRPESSPMVASSPNSWRVVPLSLLGRCSRSHPGNHDQSHRVRPHETNLDSTNVCTTSDVRPYHEFDITDAMSSHRTRDLLVFTRSRLTRCSRRARWRCLGQTQRLSRRTDRSSTLESRSQSLGSALLRRHWLAHRSTVSSRRQDEVSPV